MENIGNHRNSPGQRPKGVLDPVSACFYSVFFDKWASPGSLGDLSRLLALTDPLAGKQGSPPTTLRSAFRVVFAAPEASKRPFCALKLPTVLRIRFWRSPESILGANLASKMFIVDHVVPGPVDSFLELIFHRCLLRVPSEICLLRALREKDTFGLRPTKTMEFHVFCICAVPPATQQGRQQRTTYSIEIGPKNIQILK